MKIQHNYSFKVNFNSCLKVKVWLCGNITLLHRCFTVLGPPVPINEPRQMQCGRAHVCTLIACRAP